MDQTTITVPSELFANAESSSFAGTYLPEVLSVGPDTYSFAQPLSWSVLLTNTGGALLVSGSITGTGATQCARCLEPMDVHFAGEVEGYFLLNSEDVSFEEGEEDEFDVLGPENTIDLIPLLEAALRLNAPLQPLCKDNCKGICPDCGINLNEEECSCAQKRAAADAEFEMAKNPFSVLKDLDL